MKLSIWRQFSSNHSADIQLVGKFKSVEDRRKAEHIVRDIIANQLPGDGLLRWQITAHDELLEVVTDEFDDFIDDTAHPLLKKMTDTIKSGEAGVLGGIECHDVLYHLEFDVISEESVKAVQELVKELTTGVQRVGNLSDLPYPRHLYLAFNTGTVKINQTELHLAVGPIAISIVKLDEGIALSDINAILHRHLAGPINFIPVVGTPYKNANW